MTVQRKLASEETGGGKGHQEGKYIVEGKKIPSITAINKNMK